MAYMDMNDGPRDTPTAISQALPKWPSGWPSVPLKALEERELQKEERRKRRTQHMQGRRRMRG